MRLSIGQKVKLHNIEASIVQAWAMGQHIKYTLSDGREIHDDLTLLIASGQLQIVADPNYVEPTKPPFKKKFDFDGDKGADIIG